MIKLIILLLTIPKISYSYLDGGFLSMVIQSIVALIAVTIIYLRFTFDKVKKILKKILQGFKFK